MICYLNVCKQESTNIFTLKLFVLNYSNYFFKIKRKKTKSANLLMRTISHQKSGVTSRPLEFLI